MATEAENLQQARENIAARLEEILRSWKPSYAIDSQSVQHTEHMKALGEMIAFLRAETQESEGPYEIHQRGVT